MATVNIRIDAAAHRLLVKLAKADRRTLSGYLLSLLTQKAKEAK